ncbi:MAG TPA: hypothetical protein PLZ12_09000 [Saprospiraceae bacterium]|nr:hypothetical protein [Saprospiraceae bacterium]
MSETAQNPLNTFIIYAREDKDALLELKKQLIPLERSRQIALWYDGEIVPGEVKEVCLSWPNYEQPLARDSISCGLIMRVPPKFTTQGVAYKKLVQLPNLSHLCARSLIKTIRRPRAYSIQTRPTMTIASPQNTPLAPRFHSLSLKPCGGELFNIICHFVCIHYINFSLCSAHTAPQADT